MTPRDLHPRGAIAHAFCFDLIVYYDNIPADILQDTVRRKFHGEFQDKFLVLLFPCLHTPCLP